MICLIAPVAIIKESLYWIVIHNIFALIIRNRLSVFENETIGENHDRSTTDQIAINKI